jgi:hypothetical protein
MRLEKIAPTCFFKIIAKLLPWPKSLVYLSNLPKKLPKLAITQSAKIRSIWSPWSTLMSVGLQVIEMKPW